MEISPVLFYLLATVTVVCALGVVVVKNPVYSAFSLVLTMVSIAFLFFALQAYFIAGVQLAVYAGAVTVLFVMVLMLFDLKKEKEVFAKGRFSGALKIASAGWLCGLIAGAVFMSSEMITKSPVVLDSAPAQMLSTKNLSILLFTDYIFAFEALGLLLLLIAIGVVSIARSKGGTHAKP